MQAASVVLAAPSPQEKSEPQTKRKITPFS